MFDGTTAFIAGMALFLGFHVCYIGAFVRAGVFGKLRRPPLLAVPIAYALMVAVAMAWLWQGLGSLAVPVAVYAVALVTMATTAAAHGWRVGLGGTLFCLSDLLIGMRVADVGQLPGPPVWVMATYVLGQALIVTGWAARVPAAPARSLEQVAA